MPASPSISFQKDDKGRINRRTLNLGGEAETRRYTYDSAGRLARVSDGRGSLLESYQYDGDGRRLADINPQRFTGERRYSYSLGNRLLQAGAVQYGHDKAGFRNLKIEAGRETRYRYEPSGLLLAVDLPDGRRIEYGYDARGQRTGKRIDGRVAEAFRWLDPLRLEEFHDGREWWRLAYDSERPGRGNRTPIGVTNGDDSYLLLCDQLGTPLALVDLDGNVVQTMRYDAFGNPLRGLQGPVRLPLGFAGGLFDADTGLTRFVWRDYDADTGRFTALDPLREKGGDTDWYGYCLDDPVNRVDVWGLEAEDAEKGGKPYYCGLSGGVCDENGTLQGDYKPIDIHSGKEPFLLDFSVPLPKTITVPFGDDPNSPETRIPLSFDLVTPFRMYDNRRKNN
jgi:RHS repeat-associated protein